MKWWHVLGAILLGLLLGLWTVGVRFSLPILFFCEPILPLLVAFFLFRSRGKAWIFGLIAFFILDVYQIRPWPIGIWFVLIFLSVSEMAVRYVIANRSFYSALGLLLVGRLIGFFLIRWSGDRVGLWQPPDGSFGTILGFLFTCLADLFLLWIFSALCLNGWVVFRRQKRAHIL